MPKQVRSEAHTLRNGFNTNSESRLQEPAQEGFGKESFTPTLEDLLTDPNSPFLDLDSPMTAYEWLKMVLMLPINLGRALLVALILPPVWLYLLLLTHKLALNEPLPRWRATALLPFLRFWGRVLLGLGFSIWPRIKGQHNLEAAYRARAIIVFNHVSYMDGLILASLFPLCGLAKASVAEIPFFGTVVKAMQFLFVQRAGTSDLAVTGSPGSSGSSSTQAVHQRAEDPRYPLFIIGPEGTTKHSSYMLQFSTGAFVGGRPVLPVLLKYHCRYFNVGWGVIQSLGWHFFRIISQFVNHCDVEILPAYIPSPAERSDPRLYADNVRRLMADTLGAELSAYGIPEQQKLKKAGYCTDWLGRRIIRQPLQRQNVSAHGKHQE